MPYHIDRISELSGIMNCEKRKKEKVAVRSASSASGSDFLELYVRKENKDDGSNISKEEVK